MVADIIVDLQYGDCGKGKVSHLLSKENGYTHVLRYNGGCNAGHTIFHEGKKFITHHIPCGVFFGIPSIIGPGCVLDITQFKKELEELSSAGVNVKDLVFIAENTHIITDKHKEEDKLDSVIGTTKKGNGPAYRDKYSRVGIRAKDVEELKPYLIDLFDEFQKENVYVLCEGAQGFGLDIDWGDYPFVTSSHCTSASALLNCIPFSSVKNVWGIMKPYETYVGLKEFEPKEEIFDKIRVEGGEYGATTSRPRQINWLNMNLLKKAMFINGVTHLVLNKMDVLDNLNVWKVIEDGEVKDLETKEKFENYFHSTLNDWFPDKKFSVYFSHSPESL